MGRKWNNIKEKKPKRIKTLAEFMLNLVKKYMLQQNQASLIQIQTKHYA